MKCVVYTFETESVDCILYKDAIDGAIQSASTFTLGFCPKPDSKFSITYNNKKIPINIPLDIESKFWCYEDPFTAKEHLCIVRNLRWICPTKSKVGEHLKNSFDSQNICIGGLPKKFWRP